MITSTQTYAIKQKLALQQTLTQDDFAILEELCAEYQYPVGFFFAVYAPWYSNTNISGLYTYINGYLTTMFSSDYTATEISMLAYDFTLAQSNLSSLSKTARESLLDTLFGLTQNYTTQDPVMTYVVEDIYMNILILLDADVGNYFNGYIQEVLDILQPIETRHNAFNIVAKVST